MDSNSKSTSLWFSWQSEVESSIIFKTISELDFRNNGKREERRKRTEKETYVNGEGEGREKRTKEIEERRQENAEEIQKRKRNPFGKGSYIFARWLIWKSVKEARETYVPQEARLGFVCGEHL